MKLTQNITLQNRSNKKKTYSTRVELLDTKSGVHTSFPSSISVQANSTEEICIPFTFSIDPKDYKRIDGLEFVNSTFSPNGDTILDDNLIHYYLVTPVDDVTLHANLITKDRVMYQGTIFEGKNETPGYKPLKWNGTKTDGSQLPDGLYQIEAVTSNSGGETKQTAAVFIDRTTPKLSSEVDQENLVIKKKIDDILLDRMTESGWIASGLPVTMQYEINGNEAWKPAFVNAWEKSFGIYFERNQLQQEKNTIHIVATDAAGNKSELNVDLEIK